jgi:hypothetical protein
MAVQKTIIPLSGKLDDKIFFYRDGKHLIRSGTEKYHLSVNSVRSSTEFGRSSAAAALVKHAFYPIVRSVADNKFSLRLTACFRNIISTAYNCPKGEREVHDGDISLLKDFQFNRYRTGSALCAIQPLVTIRPAEGIDISLPGFVPGDVVTAPPQAAVMVIQLSCCACDFTKKNGVVARADDLPIYLHAAFPGGELHFPTDNIDNKILLVAIGFSFADKDGLAFGGRKYTAGSIIEAALVRNGQIVPFNYPEEKPEPATQQPTTNRVAWKIYGE